MKGTGIRRNRFTERQIEILRRSPYVRYVCDCSVSFTSEFKKEFWRLYSEENMAPFDILERLGIDYYMLGSSRVQGITNNIKKELKRNGNFAEKSKIPVPENSGNLSAEEEVKQLRLEIEYLRQEQEFLKKIIEAEREGKSK